MCELLLYKNFLRHLRLSQRKLLQKNSTSEIITFMKKDIVCIAYLITNYITINTCSIYIYFTRVLTFPEYI